MNLLLRRARWFDGERCGEGDLRLAGGRVAEMGSGLAARAGERLLDLDGRLVLPGLINGHDHLGLALLPRLGSPPYPSFYDWAEEVHRPRDEPVRSALGVPLPDRLLWGALRNLAGGATTVAHHDPWPGHRLARRLPVRLVHPYGWIHSLGYGRLPRLAWWRSRGPFFVHAAEGTDERAAAELDRLCELGLLAPRTVVVHGIALSPAQRDRLAARGASLAWCPASNRWLYDAVAPVADLDGRVRLALGTDSTLSGSAHLLDELRAAAAEGALPPQRLLELVTAEGARALGLDDGRGRLAAGGPADLVVIDDDARSPAQALLAATPTSLDLVVVAGRPRLANPETSARLDLGGATCHLDGAPRWLDADLAGLERRTTSALGDRPGAGHPPRDLLAPISAAAPRTG